MSEAEFSDAIRPLMPLARDVGTCATPPLIVPELDGPFSRADFVQVDWFGHRAPARAVIEDLACFRSVVAVRVYSRLLRAHPCSTGDITDRTGFSASSVRCHVGRLLDRSWLVRLSDGRIRANWRKSVPRFRLSTYELKLTDYRRACRQLVNHMVFADRVALVMPRPCRVETRERVIDAVSQYPACLYFVTDDNATERVLWSSVQRANAEWRLCALGKACAQHIGL